MIVIVIRSLLVLMLAGVSCRSTFAADLKEEAQALFEFAQHREDLVQKGIRWHWTVKRGVCRSIGDGLKGEFDKHHPIDVYACRWLSNDKRFLYESIAKQDVRVLSRDTQQRIITTSSGSEIYLSTQKSRLIFYPNASSGLDGQVQSRLRGFSDGWGPNSVSIHGGMFGMGKSRNILEYASNSMSKLTIDRGTTATGVDSKIVRIEAPNGLRGEFYFSSSRLTLLQSDQFRDDVLARRVLILDTLTLSEGGREVEIPSRAVSCTRSEDDDSWKVNRLITDNVELEAVPLAEMSVKIINAQVELYPTFGLRPTGTENDVSAENLDDVVEHLFVKAERKDRARKNRKQASVFEADRSGWRTYLVAINVAVLLIGICLYFNARRKRQQRSSANNR